MLDLLKAVVLGTLQGLTEFLPISSSAHLRILPELLGWERRRVGRRVDELLDLVELPRALGARMPTEKVRQASSATPWCGTLGGR